MPKEMTISFFFPSHSRCFLSAFPSRRFLLLVFLRPNAALLLLLPTLSHNTNLKQLGWLQPLLTGFVFHTPTDGAAAGRRLVCCPWRGRFAKELCAITVRYVVVVVDRCERCTPVTTKERGQQRQ